MNKAEQSAMKTLKRILIENQVFSIFNFDADTEVYTNEGSFHPINYWNKKTSKDERRMHNYNLEVKAAYLVTTTFRHYFLGRKFKLFTECAA